MNWQPKDFARRHWGLGAVGLLAIGLALVPVSDGGAKASAGYMGVTLQDLDEELRSSYGLRNRDGVLVSDVQTEGPAEKAGIQRGDILLRVAGQTVSNSSDVMEKVSSMAPGETAMVTVWRSGREHTFRVVLTERPWRYHSDRDHERPFVYEWKGKDGKSHTFEFHGDADDFMLHGAPMPDMEQLHENLRDMNVFVGSRGRLGVRTQDLNDQLGAYFQVPEAKGVLVLEVLEDTPAQKAGIAAGDVIVSVDGTGVATTSDLASELRKKDEGAVRVEVYRRGARQSLTAQLEKREAQGWSLYAPRAPRAAPRAPRAYRYYAPRAPERREMQQDLDRLRREMRELEREMDQLRREMERDGS